MKRQIYNICREPTGPSYFRLVTFCARLSSKAILVVRKVDEQNHKILSLLDELKALGATVSSESEWPGTILTRGGVACVYCIPINAASVVLLCQTVAGLFDWLSPNMPEDLCFIRDDGTPVLTSITHEKDAFLTLDDAEIASFHATLELRTLLIKP